MADLDAFDLDAAGLRADGHDLAIGVEVLARKLELALPAQTKVERRARSLFNRDKVVAGIDVRLGEGHYTLALREQEIQAQRAVEVRGIVIRREELGLDVWVQTLRDELRAEAQGSAQAREALERLTR